MSSDIFRHADESLMKVFNSMSREFQNLGTSLGFDELNVLGVRDAVKSMYARLDSRIKREYQQVAIKAYRDAALEMDFDDDDFDAYLFVYDALKEYNPLSDFVYTHEWERKRDRLFESIVATQRGNQEMRKSLKRGMDVLANQVRQYADNITIKARITAFRNAGVRYVRWVAEKDDRTCKECLRRDGVIYRIDDIQRLMPAHWRCRCRFMAATEEEYLRQQAA